MKTFETAKIPSEQLDALEQFAESETGPELRAVLLSLSHYAREADALIVGDNTATVTPTQAAERLGMSRTHLYKLLDRGEIASHRVGRDRRIRLRDLAAFDAQRDRDRSELAERFAHQHKTTADAANEIADLL
ncbi:excisionase family DNA-binding protein [Kribbella solani]|uniref:Excisionase family DNA binding protein n=1 Tax=Kribbella solani TaxID=236067 RepID=A0A841DT17_9ACTN|nr:helix-turn-helix domain-containing protein [Kribbella solani]MBB5981139.1 excisionase family DNA binding protein [Kribbella solani]